MGESFEEKLARLQKEGVGSKVEHKTTDYSHHSGKDKPKYNKSYNGGNNSRFRSNNSKPLVNEFSKEAATAPYNFISLPAKALASGLDEYVREADDVGAGYERYIAKNEAGSGYIDLELETLTPLFIRGEGSLPFMLGDKPVLPGSSLRGMIKNIFKIITMGSMRAGEDYYDRHVFFRRIMASKGKDYQWAHELKDMYHDRLKSEEKSTVKPGFIIKVKDKYYVVPVSRDYKDTIKHYEKAVGEYGEITRTKNSDIKWHGTSAYILTGNLGIRKDFEHGLFETIEQYENYKADCRLRGDKNSLLKMGKQMVRYIKLEDAHWNDRTEINFKEYQLDNNRGGVDLLSKSKMKEASVFAGKVNIPKDIKSIAPCYYVPAEGIVELFGHGQCFRIPYKNSIKDIVEKTYKEYDEDVIDYTDAVFGRSPDFASRVYFEDAIPKNKVDLMPEFKAHPLLQPNPTSFQLYLKNEIGKQLANWDSSNAEIRGYKLYWHQGNGKADMKASQEELEGDKTPEGKMKPEDKIQCRPMKPIPANTKFFSRIRFKNLLPEELGALLLTLDLNQTAANIAFKLGHGKSLGLGSIKLNKHELYVESKEAYTSFLSGNTMADSCEKAEASAYKKMFEQSIPEDLQSDWMHIMKELSDMLDFDNTRLPGWTKETSSMKGQYKMDKRGKLQFKIHDGFNDRRALPTVEQVIERSKK